jgi:hypothetical protein
MRDLAAKMRDECYAVLTEVALGELTFDGTKIALLIPCRNFLSAGTMVAKAPHATFHCL